jgi:hypothetical protein
LRPRQ